MVDLSSTLQTVAYFIGIVVALTTAYTIVRSRGIKGQQADSDRTIKIQGENITALQQQAEILQKDLLISKSDHIKSLEAIRGLEQQVKTYKDLQLDKIATAMESFAESMKVTADTNQQILNTLQAAATPLTTQPAATTTSTTTLRVQPVTGQI